MKHSKYKLRDLVELYAETINPAAYPDTVWDVYSLPAFDSGVEPEHLQGREIGSNKYVIPEKCILFNKLNVRFRRVWMVCSARPNKICSTEFLPMKVRAGICDRYIYYALITDSFTNRLAGVNTNTSGSHKRVDPQFILDSEIYLPDLPTQLRIAGVIV